MQWAAVHWLIPDPGPNPKMNARAATTYEACPQAVMVNICWGIPPFHWISHTAHHRTHGRSLRLSGQDSLGLCLGAGCWGAEAQCWAPEAIMGNIQWHYQWLQCKDHSSSSRTPTSRTDPRCWGLPVKDGNPDSWALQGQAGPCAVISHGHSCPWCDWLCSLSLFCSSLKPQYCRMLLYLETRSWMG